MQMRLDGALARQFAEEAGLSYPDYLVLRCAHRRPDRRMPGCETTADLAPWPGAPNCSLAQGGPRHPPGAGATSLVSSRGAGADGYGEDPGWRRSLVGLIMLVPGISLLVAQHRAGQVDGLVLLRTVYLSFVSALVAIALVVAVIPGIPADPETSQGLGVATIIVVVVGLVSLLGVRQFSNRALECNSEEDLAESYRKSFFLGVALADLAALVAFVASFVVGAGWLYLLGAAFSAIGFVQLAPTIGHLARRQEDLSRAGCKFSLRAAVGRLPFRPR